MGRYKNKRKARRAAWVFGFACALLTATLFLQWAFSKSEPVILPLAEQEFADLITEIVYSTVNEIELENIVVPYYAEDGGIAYMKTDTQAVNSSVTTILDAIESRLGDEDVRIAIPIGDIVGDALSLGQGPDILIELNQYKATKAKPQSSFEAAGINQTLHRLTLDLEVEAVVLLPGLNPEKVRASLCLPLSETVIVGDIPRTYIN